MCKLNNSKHLRRLIFALTKNCFINEHIFTISAEENCLLEKLQKKLSDDLLKEKFDELKWGILLSYKRIQDIEFPVNIKLSNEFKKIKKIFFDNRKEEALLGKISYL